YGLMLTGIFSLIFIVAKIFGLEHVIWLRFINYLAFFPVGYLALKNVYQATHKLDYFYGLKTAFLTCLFGQLFYALLFFIYLHFDKPFVAFINSQMPAPLLEPELSISFILFSEGFGWSAITALAIMQIFKWKRGR